MGGRTDLVKSEWTKDRGKGKRTSKQSKRQRRRETRKRKGKREERKQGGWERCEDMRGKEERQSWGQIETGSAGGRNAGKALRDWKRADGAGDWGAGSEVGKARKEASGWSPRRRPAGYPPPEDGLQLQRHRQARLRTHAQPQAGGECERVSCLIPASAKRRTWKTCFQRRLWSVSIPTVQQSVNSWRQSPLPFIVFRFH